ncbi:MAG: CBS domain-containing protein, partial [Proteobacteria bacterium]|nr:CBS domain-containing protein [Pseudomonadota bacterium]
MNADHATDGNGHGTSSWFARLNKALTGEPQDREQLLDLLRDAEKRNLVDAQALAMIEGVMQVGEMQVRDIMVPRTQMVVVNADSHPNDFIASVTESGHSRFPVIGDNRDEVEGILLAKDLLGYYARGEEQNFDMDDAIRPAVFIPESKRLNVLLREFRENRNHMAIVVDEYGGVAGLVTIEDVLEQIVGEIDDAHDTEEGSYIRRLGNGEYTVKAITPIEDFNVYFKTDFSDDVFDTIG